MKTSASVLLFIWTSFPLVPTSNASLIDWVFYGLLRSPRGAPSDSQCFQV